MSSFSRLAARGLASALLLITFGGYASADGHGGPVYEDVTFNGGIRARGNWFDFDDNALDNSYTEQRTRFGAHASFSDDVNAMIEFQSYNQWGDDLVQDPFTGVTDGRGADVEMYQAYMDVGSDMRLRVGRQEMTFGNEWLVGNNDTNANFSGLSFDGLRLTHTHDALTIDAWAMKVAEGNSDFGDDDTDFYGIYGSYEWCDTGAFDFYAMLVRDEAGLATAAFGGTDADLYTVGARAHGAYDSGIDYSIEVAYQFGGVDATPGGDLDFSSIGANLEVGYAFDSDMSPRVYFNYAYLPGNDGSDIGFQRMFSDVEYSMFQVDSNLTNAHVFIWGATMDAADDMTVGADIKYFMVEEEVGADDDLGLELHLYGDYAYTDFLNFRAGWALAMPGDAAEQGNSNAFGGSAATSLADDDNLNYLYIESSLMF